MLFKILMEWCNPNFNSHLNNRARLFRGDLTRRTVTSVHPPVFSLYYDPGQAASLLGLPGRH